MDKFKNPSFERKSQSCRESIQSASVLGALRSSFLNAVSALALVACDGTFDPSSSSKNLNQPSLDEVYKASAKVKVSTEAGDVLEQYFVSSAGEPPAVKPGTQTLVEEPVQENQSGTRSKKKSVLETDSLSPPIKESKKKTGSSSRPAKDRFIALATQMKQSYDSNQIESPRCTVIRTSGVTADWPVDEQVGPVRAGDQVRFFALLSTPSKGKEDFSVTLDYSGTKYNDITDNNLTDQNGASIPITRIYNIPSDIQGTQTFRVTWRKGKKQEVLLCSTSFQVE